MSYFFNEIVENKNIMKFRELYRADLYRYGGNAEMYIKVFHFLLRKLESTNFFLLRLIYKILFRLWSEHRGLEIPANKHIGGGYLFWACL